MATFTFVGTISVPKETEKFHPFEIKESSKGTGWISIRNRFNVSERDSRHFVSIEGGKFKDEHNVIYIHPEDENNLPKCVQKREKDGKTSYYINFADRKNPDVLAAVPRYSKFSLDLNSKSLRYMLKGIGEKLDSNDSLNPDELKALGVESMADAKAAYEKALRRKMEFLSEYDFAEMVKKAFDNNAFDGKKVCITGTVSHTYSEVKDRFYENYSVKSIYVVDPQDEESGHLNVDFLYMHDAVTEAEDKLVIRGYYLDRVGNPINKHVPISCGFVIPITEDTKKTAELLKNRFYVMEDDVVVKRSVILDVIDGSPKIEITDDMLTAEQREDLEYGIITREDLEKEFGDDIRGERITELRFVKWGRGGSTPENTSLKPDQMNFVNPNIKTDAEPSVEEAAVEEATKTDDDDLGLFS